MLAARGALSFQAAVLADRRAVLTLEQAPLVLTQRRTATRVTPRDGQAMLAARGAVPAAGPGPAVLAGAVSAPGAPTLAATGADAVVFAHGAPAALSADGALLAVLADGAAPALLADGLQTPVLAELFGAGVVTGCRAAFSARHELHAASLALEASPMRTQCARRERGRHEGGWRSWERACTIEGSLWRGGRMWRGRGRGPGGLAGD